MHVVWLVNGDAVLIYKILLPSEWADFEASGRFDGSSFDRRSGFIHCSSRDQVGDTALRLFAAEPALVVVALEESDLGESLRWEETADRSTFPHVYAPISLEAVAAVHRIASASSVDQVISREDRP